MPYLRHAIRNALTVAANESMVMPARGRVDVADDTESPAAVSAHRSSMIGAKEATALALSSLKSSAIDWLKCTRAAITEVVKDDEENDDDADAVVADFDSFFRLVVMVCRSKQITAASVRVANGSLAVVVSASISASWCSVSATGAADEEEKDEEDEDDPDDDEATEESALDLRLFLADASCAFVIDRAQASSRASRARASTLPARMPNRSSSNASSSNDKVKVDDNDNEDEDDVEAADANDAEARHQRGARAAACAATVRTAATSAGSASAGEL